MSEVKSYFVCLPKCEYDSDSEIIKEMRMALNSLVGKDQYVIKPRPVALNILDYIVDILAFDVKEHLNRNIIRTVEKYLSENNIEYTEYSMYLPLNAQRIFDEVHIRD